MPHNSHFCKPLYDINVFLKDYRSVKINNIYLKKQWLLLIQKIWHCENGLLMIIQKGNICCNFHILLQNFTSPSHKINRYKLGSLLQLQVNYKMVHRCKSALCKDTICCLSAYWGIFRNILKLTCIEAMADQTDWTPLKIHNVKK